jgi:hypothetical protein
MVTLTSCFGQPSIWLKSWWIIAANSSTVFVCLTGFAGTGCSASWLTVDVPRSSGTAFVRLAVSKKLKDRALCCDDDAGIGAFVFVGHFSFAFSASIASVCAILSARTSQA